MATALAKLFKKKHNKENNEPFLKHQEDADSVARSSSANSSVYVGDYSAHSLPRGGPALIPNPNNFKWKSPYSVITEPQTRKSTRSCPGGPAQTRSSFDSLSRPRYRHLSPDQEYGSSRRVRYNNSRHPTIFEVSGSYENYPNDGAHDGALALDEQNLIKSGSRKIIQHQRILAAHNTDAYGGSIHSQSVFQRHQNKRQSLNLRNNMHGDISRNSHVQRANAYHRSRQRHANVPAPTSEYGSADPSPTNPASNALFNKRASADYFREQSFGNTDYDDSDSDEGTPLSIVDICEQQVRKFAAERNEYKAKARNYKRKYLEACAKLEETMAELTNEKRENESLKVNLHNANTQVENFRSFINQQFRNVNGHYRNWQQEQRQQQRRWLQDQRPQQHFMQENLLSQLGEQQQQQKITNNGCVDVHHDAQLSSGSRHHIPVMDNEEWRSDNDHLFGAGEALCSRTELYGSVNPAFTADFPSSSMPSEKEENISITTKEDHEDDADEVKIFRNLEIDEEKESSLSYSAIEEARASSTGVTQNSLFPHHTSQTFSPPSFKQVKDGPAVMELVNDEENSADVENINEIHDPIMKELPNCGTSADQSISQKTATIHDCDDADESSDDSLDINNLEKYTKQSVKIRCVAPSPPRQGQLGARRSFSDTDLTNLYMQNECQRNNPGVTHLDDAILFHKKGENDDENLSRHRKQVGFDEAVVELKGGARRLFKDRYCRYSPKRNGDHSSSYSSDDDAIRIIARQLRKRGDLVHFRPRRKNLVNMEHKLFRCFGSGEREAIAQFDYLKDMPTDLSGLVSSPSSQ